MECSSIATGRWDQILGDFDAFSFIFCSFSPLLFCPTFLKTHSLSLELKVRCHYIVSGQNFFLINFDIFKRFLHTLVRLSGLVVSALKIRAR